MSCRRLRGRGAYGVIKARYIKNQGAKGQQRSADLKRLIYYNVYGNRKLNKEMKPRGRILNSSGQEVKYGKHKNWALSRAKHSRYTYRVIISPKGKLLEDADFVSAIGEAGVGQGWPTEFQLVVHHDTAHTHAHLIFHSDKTFGRRQLEDWKAAVREQLIEREQSKEVTPKQLAQQKSEDKTETKRRRRRRRRSRSKSRGEDLSL